MAVFKIDDQNGVCVFVVAEDEEQALEIATRKLAQGKGLSAVERHVRDTLGDAFDPESAEAEEIDSEEEGLLGGFIY
jgi:hypothetical protein